jgi:hypothetical protein
MTNQHPIIPPPQLVQQWFKQAHESADPDNQLSYYDFIATAAAQWGADYELEKCCEWLKLEGHEHEHAELREARRPPAPTEADQALAALEADPKDGAMIMIDSEQFSIIHRALRRLKELESLND